MPITGLCAVDQALPSRMPQQLRGWLRISALLEPEKRPQHTRGHGDLDLRFQSESESATSIKPQVDDLVENSLTGHLDGSAWIELA